VVQASELEELEAAAEPTRATAATAKRVLAFMVGLVLAVVGGVL
jgi:hypothetical protein